MSPSPFPSEAQLWTGRVLSTLAVLFMLTDAGMKIVKPGFVVKATVELGFPENTIVGIGVALLAATLLYAIPATAAVGAVLLTGFLGGAVAANVRLNEPLFSHSLFPVYIAVMVWAGLCLRVARVRAAFLAGPR